MPHRDDREARTPSSKPRHELAEAKKRWKGLSIERSERRPSSSACVRSVGRTPHRSKGFETDEAEALDARRRRRASERVRRIERHGRLSRSRLSLRACAANWAV